ncbi:MAG: hypothetical protein U1E26_00955 [Coriobacteriia bacterium]|nr:hypothetical protein [Coriobacteriia bacterium]
MNPESEIPVPEQPLQTPPQYQQPLPAPAKKRPVGLIIGIVVALVLLLVGAGIAVAVARNGLAARSSAGEAIKAAEKTWDEAQIAVEPGSREADESEQSKAALSEAKSLYRTGFFVLASKYEAAQSEAQRAEKLALAISNRVAELTAEAEKSSGSEAISLYFDIRERYPRTPAGAEAIDKAADVLVNGSFSSDRNCLDRVSTFMTGCPDQVPESVKSLAKTRVKSAASTSLNRQNSQVKDHLKWAKDMRSGKRVSMALVLTSGASASDLDAIIKRLESVECSEYRTALNHLRAAAKTDEKVRKAASSPFRRSGGVSYFNSSQISKIEKLSKEMQSTLKKAKTALDKT